MHHVAWFRTVRADGGADVQHGVRGVGDEGEVHAFSSIGTSCVVLRCWKHGVFTGGAEFRHRPAGERRKYLLCWAGVLCTCDNESIERVFGYASFEAQGVIAVYDFAHHSLGNSVRVLFQVRSLSLGALSRVDDLPDGFFQLFDALFAQPAHYYVVAVTILPFSFAWKPVEVVDAGPVHLARN